MADTMIVRENNPQGYLDFDLQRVIPEGFSLEETLDYYIPHSFYEMAFCWDVMRLNEESCYASLQELNEVRKMKRGMFPFPVLEGILENSFGVAVWDFQIEAILGLCVNSKKDLIRFRDGLNSKDPAVLQELDNIPFGHEATEVSLLEVLETKMLFPRWKKMSIRATMRLWETLLDQPPF
jgi:hypothetical protein